MSQAKPLTLKKLQRFMVMALKRIRVNATKIKTLEENEMALYDMLAALEEKIAVYEASRVADQLKSLEYYQSDVPEDTQPTDVIQLPLTATSPEVKSTTVQGSCFSCFFGVPVDKDGIMHYRCAAAESSLHGKVNGAGSWCKEYQKVNRQDVIQHPVHTPNKKQAVNYGYKTEDVKCMTVDFRPDKTVIRSAYIGEMEYIYSGKTKHEEFKCVIE